MDLQMLHHNTAQQTDPMHLEMLIPQEEDMVDNIIMVNTMPAILTVQKHHTAPARQEHEQRCQQHPSSAMFRPGETPG